VRRLAPAVLLAGSLLLTGCGTTTPASFVEPSPSPSASVATGHAPTRTFAVATRTLDFHRGERPLETTVYYPKNAAGPFPVVVFGHGFGGTPAAYSALLQRWASAGFVVAAPAFPHTSWGVKKPDLLDVVNQPADVGSVLSGLSALPPSDGLRKIIDPSRAAVAGHSAGAITALGVFTDDGPEKRDKRFSAGIVLAGNSIGVGTTFSGASAPLLFVHAADDPVVPYWTGLGAYDAVPWPRAMVKLTGQEHTAPYLSKSDKQFRVVAAATVDFLRWSLYNDAAAHDRLVALPNLDAHL
jgi:dienelactone hydrolase